MNFSGEIENESRWSHQCNCTCREGVLLWDAVCAVFFFLAVSQGIHICARAWIRAAPLIFLFQDSQLRIWNRERIFIAWSMLIYGTAYTYGLKQIAPTHRYQIGPHGSIPKKKTLCQGNCQKTITTGKRVRQENGRGTIQDRTYDRKAPKFYIATRGYLVPVTLNTYA
jgi:hypothetical protein